MGVSAGSEIEGRGFTTETETTRPSSYIPRGSQRPCRGSAAWERGEMPSPPSVSLALFLFFVDLICCFTWAGKANADSVPGYPSSKPSAALTSSWIQTSQAFLGEGLSLPPSGGGLGPVFPCSPVSHQAAGVWIYHPWITLKRSVVFVVLKWETI